MRHRLARSVSASTAAGALTLGTIAGPATAAPPPGACLQQTAPGRAIHQLPWAQQTLAPQRAWPFSTGAGVLVAVIDSGVDTEQPQLSGKVRPGYDFLRNKPGADFDCVSHGTAVAGIIAAGARTGYGFRGVAPGARILPLRISDAEPDDNGAGRAVNPTVFARSIRYAADQGARVINLSVVMYADVPVVRAAVRYAQAKGALLVAAAGNQHATTGGTGMSRAADPTPYPAAYPGVLGVGAITIDGTRLPASQVGPYVDLTAPGGGVLAPTREHGYLYWDGTSFATPFVSGTAALIRSEYPGLSPAAVADRLIATADPAPGGPDSGAYGRGIVDPYRAVTDSIIRAGPGATPAPLHRPAPDLAAARRAARARQRAASAGHAVLVVALVVAALLVGVAALSLSRRRRHATTPGA